jgi:NADH-quinone oxidoreductase subunit J
MPDGITNTEALGRLIYTDFVYLFQAAGIVLLIAMIGAIVLTLRSREGVRRQSVARQVARPREEVVAIRKVPTRGGV